MSIALNKCFSRLHLDTAPFHIYISAAIILYCYTLLVIRLSRTGRNKVPTFRIVVAEKTKSAKGKYHETLGEYKPAASTPVINFNKDRILYWVSKGAQPSDTIARLLFKQGVAEMKRFFEATKKWKKRNKNAPVEQPAAPATAAAPATTPTEESETPAA